MKLSLTLRQLVRISRKGTQQPHTLPQVLRDAVLVQFLPSEIRQAVERWISQSIPREKPTQRSAFDAFLHERSNSVMEALRKEESSMHLVPNILFHENPRHSEILQGNFMHFQRNIVTT